MMDWLLFRSFQQLKLKDKVLTLQQDPGGDSIAWQLRDVYLHLTDALEYICIISSALVFLRFPWFYYMFFRSRSKFRSGRDGVPHKQTVLERYGADLLSLVAVVGQTVPVTTILLLGQISVSCRFYLYFNDVIFMWYVIVTLLSIAWKSVELLISVCHESRDSRGGVLCLLRTILGALLLCAAVVSVLNAVLLDGHKNIKFLKPSRNKLMDKVLADDYILSNGIYLKQELSSDINTYFKIADLSELVEHNSTDYQTPMMPCNSANLTREVLDGQSGSMQHCHYMCHFQYHDVNMKIYYQCLYHMNDMNCFHPMEMSSFRRRRTARTQETTNAPSTDATFLTDDASLDNVVTGSSRIGSSSVQGLSVVLHDTRMFHGASDELITCGASTAAPLNAEIQSSSGDGEENTFCGYTMEHSAIMNVQKKCDA